MPIGRRTPAKHICGKSTTQKTPLRHARGLRFVKLLDRLVTRLLPAGNVPQSAASGLQQRHGGLAGLQHAQGLRRPTA